MAADKYGSALQTDIKTLTNGLLPVRNAPL
jgi:hypothetical protein